jgi:hypothetical protein
MDEDNGTIRALWSYEASRGERPLQREKRCFGVLLELTWGEQNPVVQVRVLVYVKALHKQKSTGSIEMSLDQCSSMVDSYIRSCDMNQTL